MFLGLLARAASAESTGSSNSLYNAPFDDAAGPPLGRRKTGVTAQQSETIIGVLTMFLVLCVAAVVGRVISRRMSRQKLGSDDLWVLGAMTFFIGQASVVYYNQSLVARVRNMMTGNETPDREVFHTLDKTKVAASLLYLLTITAARCSVLFLVRRIFNLRVLWFKITWWFCIVFVGLYWTYFTISTLSACAPHPISATWNDSKLCTRGNLSNPAAQSFLSVFIDLALWALPIRMIWTLQLTRPQKVAVSGVFALGLIAVFVSLARAITMVKAVSFATISGLPYFIILSTTEPAVMIICTCLPLMRPLLNSFAKALGGSSWLSSGPSRSHRFLSSRHRHSPSGGRGVDEEKTTLTSHVPTRSWPSHGIAAATTTKQSFSNRPDSGEDIQPSGSESRDSSLNGLFHSKVETRIESREMMTSPLPSARNDSRTWGKWRWKDPRGDPAAMNQPPQRSFKMRRLDESRLGQ